MNEELGGKEKHGPFKIGMCNGCHTVHQSQNPKLLSGKVPDLCYTCHNTEGFTGKNVHKPVADGKCYDCHGNHTSPYKNLSKFEGNESCRKCHKGIFNNPHPKTTLPGLKAKGSQAGHPLDSADDPRRPGRKMACVSCHNPHSSDWSDLFRYKAEKPADLCLSCHR